MKFCGRIKNFVGAGGQSCSGAGKNYWLEPRLKNSAPKPWVKCTDQPKSTLKAIFASMGVGNYLLLYITAAEIYNEMTYLYF